MQETDYVILFGILAFIIEDIGKLQKSFKQRCNVITFSFEKHESDCSECKSLLLEAISVVQVGDDGYINGVGQMG